MEVGQARGDRRWSDTGWSGTGRRTHSTTVTVLHSAQASGLLGCLSGQVEKVQLPGWISKGCSSHAVKSNEDLNPKIGTVGKRPRW